MGISVTPGEYQHAYFKMTDRVVNHMLDFWPKVEDLIHNMNVIWNTPP